MKIVFAKDAKAGLREIALFIARDNQARAISFVQELREKARSVVDTPRAFPLVPRYEHLGIRRRSYGKYLIFYRIEDDRILIVQILHNARDYKALLFPDD
jgi:plasmid stabilization system protein ParE